MREERRETIVGVVRALGQRRKRKENPKR